jgi:hypothetical protein
MLDLARFDELLDRSGNILNRDIRIDTVLIIEIDGLNTEAFQRAFNAETDLLRPTALPLLPAIESDTEFGGNDDLPLERGKRLAEQFLVDVGAINFRGIKEVDTPIHGLMDQGNHLLLVGRRAVGHAHAHAAQAERGNFKSAIAEFAFLHCCFHVD